MCYSWMRFDAAREPPKESLLRTELTRDPVMFDYVSHTFLIFQVNVFITVCKVKLVEGWNVLPSFGER